MCRAVEIISNLWGSVFTETSEVYCKNGELFLFFVGTRIEVLSLEKLIILCTSISWLWVNRNKHV